MYDREYERYKRYRSYRHAYKVDTVALIIIMGIVLHFFSFTGAIIFLVLWGIGTVGIKTRKAKPNKIIEHLEVTKEEFELLKQNAILSEEQLQDGNVTVTREEFERIKKFIALQQEVRNTQAEKVEVTMETNGNSTEVGYINKNNQRNNGKTNIPGTGNLQWFYDMECLNCGHKYHANGHDIWLRKCPKCQGGKP